ncbi:PA2169 family four-helix-bundle protein [Flavobacterium sp.]|uniref:ferritin-like domain-containing protein n=1 Tax=Flavobacterium sp. TaxID=239 RepID=UPI00286E8942|nr:PA2169 family four-helix-bundle protein [Flavobacterium sp.]
MKTEKTIAVLNSLIEINNDRIYGYETASKEVEETDLKMLFAHATETSIKLKAQLVAEVKNLGGKQTESTTTSGKIYRIWMDVKALVTGKDRKVILDSCVFGEDAAIETYNEALSNHEDLTSGQHMMITEQLVLIKMDQDNLKKINNLIELSK